LIKIKSFDSKTVARDMLSWVAVFYCPKVLCLALNIYRQATKEGCPHLSNPNNGVCYI